ncbi:MAG: hypothetical protein A2583_01680 [Bdellovibrionales bacterium RIFOXYD1_FULL_53_11]|nr:MAG: hypothetical protein A2583_01680 [Bdellovibrionales bacterium RIFOXYD1_FULL_53_11]
MDVCSLMQSKNRCLERFLRLSEKFMSDHRSCEGGLLDGLDRFQKEREDILKAISLLDKKIHETAAAIERDAVTPALSAAVKNELDRKDMIVRLIIESDLKIISEIEKLKNEMINDIARERKAGRLIGKFKSEWVPKSGEELDGSL